MGLDLRLYPNRWRSQRPLLSNAQVLDRNYELFDAIKALPAVAVPEAPLAYDDDEGLKPTATDSYGDQLTQVWAGVLAGIPEETWGRSEWNRAALAYLRTIPPDTPVVLWWS